MATAEAYDEEVSCKVSTNQEYGRSCLLENVNLETTKRLKVWRDTKYVHFENSQIERFTEEFLEQLKEVEYLNANDVGLKSVDGTSLKKIEGMKIFFGSQNELTQLEEKTFSFNKKLELIYLKFNRIEDIHPKAFEDLHELYALDISSNKLKDLGNIFDTLTSLVRLDLSLNLIESLDKSIFSNNVKLMQLNLDGNSFKYFDPDVFAPLINLEFVNLSFNKSPIETIHGDLFKDSSNLKQAFFIRNRIRAVGRRFLRDPKPLLEIVSFRSNLCIDKDFLYLNGTFGKSQQNELRQCYENYYENIE